MQNIELFKNTTAVVNRFNTLWSNEYNLMGADLQAFNQQALQSQAFKDIVFESGLFEFSNNFDKSFFDNVALILASYTNLGTYEAIINICKAILGTSTEVVFEDEGRIINITSQATLSFPIITTALDKVVSTEGDQLVAVNNRLQLQFSELEQLLRLFLPAGIKYTINIGGANG